MKGARGDETASTSTWGRDGGGVGDEDDAETRETKRKKLKMFKYKQRQQEIAAEQNQKASSWQSFQATGLKKKKRGMQTNSIFSSKT